MHSVLYSIRRTYHKSWRMSMRLLLDHCVTPSRIDVLHAIRHWGGEVLRQSVLCTLLDISAPVLSRLLRKMERHGLVRREVDPTDRRHKKVFLTRIGLYALAGVFSDLVDSGKLDKQVQTLVEGALKADVTRSRCRHEIRACEHEGACGRAHVAAEPPSPPSRSGVFDGGLVTGELSARPSVDLPGAAAPGWLGELAGTTSGRSESEDGHEMRCARTNQHKAASAVSENQAHGGEEDSLMEPDEDDAGKGAAQAHDAEQNGEAEELTPAADEFSSGAAIARNGNAARDGLTDARRLDATLLVMRARLGDLAQVPYPNGEGYFWRDAPTLESEEAEDLYGVLCSAICESDQARLDSAARRCRRGAMSGTRHTP